MSTLDAADNEQRAQIERVKEAGFAAISGRTIAQREKARATKADEWASWWRREMEIHNCHDRPRQRPTSTAASTKVLHFY